MATRFVVITSIHYPTQAVKKFSQFEDWQVVVVADLKTPQDWHLENTKILTVDEQKSLPLETVKWLPWNHYARKNLGYLYAMMHGAELIYETDDDNLPYDHWETHFTIDATIDAERYVNPGKYINAYRHFSDAHVWPRGFPLSEVLNQQQSDRSPQSISVTRAQAPVIQGLADLEPDVDAIYRLTIGQQIQFSANTPLFIGSGSYCPFNSQNTLWYPEAFPYLFLPAFVPSRVTDIWRSYIAQRFLHLAEQGVLFCNASVYQERNYHNLMRDFAEEIDLYTKTEQLVNALDSYQDDVAGIMHYLAQQGLFTSEDVALFDAWLRDLDRLGYGLT